MAKKKSQSKSASKQADAAKPAPAAHADGAPGIDIGISTGDRLLLTRASIQTAPD